ncbi:MAG: FAD-binding oxidoreductase [Steroidobacteraceae bacterium]|nr:FAD-binding oxidoreductase [Steroidobacteraceae bacterium]
MRNGIGDAHRIDPRQDFDVAIIGAGISGALVADALIGTGKRIVVIDSEEPGQGSTAASTALLQYEIDTNLSDLAKELGPERATRAYRACADAFPKLERRFPELLPLADYERRESLYLASDETGAGELRAELAARRAIGLNCEWLDKTEIERRFDCRSHGGILSALGAQMDPLKFTRALLAGCARHGVSIRPRTAVESVEEAGGEFRLALRGGDAVTAGDVIVCAGYESLKFLPRDVADVDNTFALVTEPLDEPALASMPLIWESARPYLYLRATRDGRLIVGGADVPFKSVVARELLLPKQVRKLAASYEELFGRELPPVSYAWAGSFARTRDGLPYIGPVPGMNPRLQFVLAFGGNGITYSVHAGDIVRAHLEGGVHELDDVFGFGRNAERPSASRTASSQS